MKKNLFRFLLSPDPAEGIPPVETPAPPAAPAATPPPAAEIVRDAEVTEELLQTRRKLDESERARKKLEVDTAAVIDENHRLKTAGAVPPLNKPAPEDTRSALERFMSGEDV